MSNRDFQSARNLARQFASWILRFLQRDFVSLHVLTKLAVKGSFRDTINRINPISFAHITRVTIFSQMRNLCFGAIALRSAERYLQPWKKKKKKKNRGIPRQYASNRLDSADQQRGCSPEKGSSVVCSIPACHEFPRSKGRKF